MKYAICNELYVDWALGDICAHARAHGYTGIEIAPFTLAADVRAITAAERATIRSTAESAGVEVIGLHWLLAQTEGLHLTSADADTRNRTADYLVALAHLCADLGGRVMVFGSPPQRNFPDSMNHAQAELHAAEVLRKVVPALESLDVVVALEPLGPEEGNFLPTAESAIRLAEQVGSTHVRLHLDVKAMSTEAKPIPDIIRDSRQWLEHFHANDPNRLGPGMGDIEFLPIFSALKEIGYQGWASVEVFDYDRGVDCLAGDSIRYMRGIEAALAAAQD